MTRNHPFTGLLFARFTRASEPTAQQGTGKHPHKSTEEPYPHHEAGSQRKQEQSSSKQSQSGGGQQTSSSDDLKERECRGKDGEIHHHTRTAGQQQK